MFQTQEELTQETQRMFNYNEVFILNLRKNN